MRARMVLRAWAVLAGLVAGRLGAQDAAGHLEGTVTGPADPSQVDVVLEGSGLPQARIGSPDRDGFYRFESVPTGTYQVRMRMIGYRPLTVSGVIIRLGRTTTLAQLNLDPQVLELPELTVSAEQPLIEMASAAGGANLSAQRLEALPIERNYRELPALLPGVNLEAGGLNVEGSTGLENLFFVNGINVTDPRTGASSTVLPPDFIHDVEVRTGGYEAEYRGALGGVVNVVTRSGGDAFAARLFGYYVSNRLAADPRQVVGQQDRNRFARYDVGATMGGPIARGRAWFFAAYDAAFDREQVGIPLLDVHSDHAVRHSFAGRVTWQPTASTLVEGTVLGDPTTRDGVGNLFTVPVVAPAGFANPDAWLSRTRTGGVGLSLVGTHAAGTRVVLRAALSHTEQHSDNGPRTALGRSEPLFIDSLAVWSGGFPENIKTTTRRDAASLNVAAQLGSHGFKAGVEFTEHQLDQQQLNRGIVQFGESSYFEYLFDQRGAVKNRSPGAFLQDSWRVGEHLRLNLGMRWDGEYLLGSDGHLALTIKDQWQPRVGFVLATDPRGRSRFYGSYGRFYQQLHSTVASLYHAYGSAFYFINYPQDPRASQAQADTSYGQVFQRTPRPDVKGQAYDEFSLGYDRVFGRAMRVRVRGVRRTLRWGIEDALDIETSRSMVGNPGRGELTEYPRMRREYTALELGFEGDVTPHFWMLGSYVWSRTYGNYSGLYNSDYGYVFPNTNGAFDIPEILVDGTGRLGNDRPHVLKLSATYGFRFGLAVGTSFLWQSGTPRNEFGGTPAGPPYNSFLRPRGTAGRTPATWDLGLRLSYTLDGSIHRTWGARVVLDLYHVGSPRRALGFDDAHYFDVDNLGNQIQPNPNYGSPVRFQPPMSARLGLSLGFK